MNQNKLFSYGLKETEPFEKNETLSLGRVVAQSRILYTVQTATQQIQAQVSGNFRKQAGEPVDYPAVGDWVWLHLPANLKNVGIIEELRPRTSVFVRKVAGTTSHLQVVAANIDTLFLCMALNEDFNLRRLERYLAVAYDSGAKPVIVLTKADLALNFAEQLVAVTEIAGNTQVLVCDATKESGWQELAQAIEPKKTYGFLGSSGVGKSTLINHLLGTNEQLTGDIREDDAKGRHTTTSRQLKVLPTGGIVLDTPGMRELSIVEANLKETFSDITELAKQCKFNDCTHTHEPGCAVQRALAEGLLAKTRLKSYLQLQQEQTDNQELRGKAREQAKLKKMFGSKKQYQATMKEVKKKNKRF